MARSKERPVKGAAFEVRKTGIPSLDWRDPYHVALTLSWPAFAASALAVIFAINLGFAALYLAQPGCVQNLPRGSLANAFFFSVETLATVGYGEMYPATTYGHIISAIEIMLGMASVAIFTGVLFVRFARPKAKILFAEKAVIAYHDGKPTLMIRVANGRISALRDATARLGALLVRINTEGESYRGIHELALQRDRLPIFPLTWTLMHVIDASSPLHGFSSQDLEAQDARLFLSVEAMDPDLAVRVSDLQDYPYRSVVEGARYAEAVWRDQLGTTVADLSRLHDLQPDPFTPHA